LATRSRNTTTHCGSGLAREEAQSAGENLIQKARTVPTTESDPTDWHALKPGSTLSFKPIHTGLANMNTSPTQNPMIRTDKPVRKEVRGELTSLDVRRAARDGQKAFDKFLITGRL